MPTSEERLYCSVCGERREEKYTCRKGGRSVPDPPPNPAEEVVRMRQEKSTGYAPEVELDRHQMRKSDSDFAALLKEWDQAIAERDKARTEVERLRETLASVEAQRPEWLASEVERLREQLRDCRVRLDERATIIEELEASRDRAHEDRRAAERKLAISEQRRWKLARVSEVAERIVEGYRAGHIIGSDLMREIRDALSTEEDS